MLTTIPLLFIYLSVVYATAPIAQHQIFHAGPNSELVIKLRGYDADGDVLTATISPGDTNAGLESYINYPKSIVTMDTNQKLVMK